MTDRTELQRRRGKFLGITDGAERLAFYVQHYETMKRGQADAESSCNHLKLEEAMLEYLVKGGSPAHSSLINNLAGRIRDLASYEPENASGYLKEAHNHLRNTSIPIARKAEDWGSLSRWRGNLSRRSI